VKNELDRHLSSFDGNAPHAELGNVAEGSGGSQGNGQGRNRVLISLVNIQERSLVTASTRTTTTRCVPCREG
jgi:hypothetical protein